jgi:hypothetical protein
VATWRVGHHLLSKMSLSHEAPISCSASYGTQAQLRRNHQTRMIEASIRTTKTTRRKHRRSIRNPRPSQRANLSGPSASSNLKLKSLRRHYSTRTECHSRILTPVKDPLEASTTTDQKAITATLKKCYSPIGLAIATFVTAGIYFVLQYELSVEANHLALRESCRSHPVSICPAEEQVQTAKHTARMIHTSKIWPSVKKPGSQEM